MTLRWIVLFFTCLLGACSKPTSQPKTALKSYVVKQSTIHKTMHFTGVIQPLNENALITPMDAVVETIHYSYGQRVKKGELVFTLSSDELQRQYNDTLTDYLRAKDSYSIARAKFTGTHELWNAGLLAKNNYLSEQSSLTTARVSLMQASNKLTTLTKKMQTESPDDLSHLSFSEFKKVRLALTTQHNVIQIKSPSQGVLLYPPASEDGLSKGVKSGMNIKAGQVLGMMGDLSGIRVEINVPEVDINEVKQGMSASIHSVAFGKHVLKGHLVTVNAQASVNGNGGLPTFTAIIEVRSLTKAEQAWMKVGMSAEIELAVDTQNRLLIPIAAVIPEQGSSWVNVYATNGALTKRAVTTGAISADSVVIEAGLGLGDVVVYE